MSAFVLSKSKKGMKIITILTALNIILNMVTYKSIKNNRKECENNGSRKSATT